MRLEKALRAGLLRRPVILITPKGQRVQELRDLGKSIDEAIAIADAEYTSTGMQPTPDRLVTLLAETERSHV